MVCAAPRGSMVSPSSAVRAEGGGGQEEPDPGKQLRRGNALAGYAETAEEHAVLAKEERQRRADDGRVRGEGCGAPRCARKDRGQPNGEEHGNDHACRVEAQGPGEEVYRDEGEEDGADQWVDAPPCQPEGEGDRRYADQDGRQAKGEVAGGRGELVDVEGEAAAGQVDAHAVHHSLQHQLAKAGDREGDCEEGQVLRNDEAARMGRLCRMSPPELAQPTLPVSCVAGASVEFVKHCAYCRSD